MKQLTGFCRKEVGRWVLEVYSIENKDSILLFFLIKNWTKLSLMSEIEDST